MVKKQINVVSLSPLDAEPNNEPNNEQQQLNEIKEAIKQEEDTVKPMEEAVEQQEEYDILIVTTKNDAWLMSDSDMDSDLLQIYDAGVDLFVLNTFEGYDGTWYQVDDGMGGSGGWIIDSDVTAL
jgi:hypothetical protein